MSLVGGEYSRVPFKQAKQADVFPDKLNSFELKILELTTRMLWIPP